MSAAVDAEPQFLAVAASVRFLTITSNLLSPTPELMVVESLDFPFPFMFSFSFIFDWECPGCFEEGIRKDTKMIGNVLMMCAREIKMPVAYGKSGEENVHQYF